MARYLSADLNCDNVRARQYQLVAVSCFLLLQNIVSARPAPELQIGSGHGNENNNLNADSSLIIGSTWLGVVLSLSFLIVLVSLLALCGAGECCGKIHWFGRPRQDAPLSFSNPMTEPGATMMMPISQIDVRALELDPIVFEPLPTVHDLTPISGKIQSDRGQPSNRGAGIPIVPFSVDDSNVYAHDWFEEPHNNFPRSSIEYVKELGKGWFGQVIEAEARDIVPFARKIRVIVKVLREDANGMEQMRFLDESRMYRDANHGNILKLLGHSIEKLPFILIMEHCPQGDLKSFLISNVIRAEMLNSQGTIIKMALDIAKGLEWLHTAGFVHPDLAARNCQVGSENRVVIGDYGLGTQIYKDDYHWSSNVAIPLRWTAPETLHCTSSVIQILKVNESSNIWTYGVVLWEICEFGKLPYFELADDEVISRVIIDKNYFLGQPTLQCMSAKEELYKIMSSCWQADLEHRPGLSAIITCLENLLKTFNVSITPSRDDFETKWEQLGSRTNSEEEKRRKKNVSFVGLLDMSKALQFESSSINEEGESETIRNADNTRHTNAMLDISEDLFLDQTKDFTDAEEEQWMKKFERGDITQKVLEKSQSVQDLMVLTHFDQSDMGDPDSLIYEIKSPQSSVIDGKENESNSSTLRKSCSETAIDSISFDSSSHTLCPSSVCDSQNTTLVPPDFNVSISTPANSPNRSGIDINVIAATPNPNVEINVIEATPNLPSTSKEEDAESKIKDNLDNSNPPVSRKLHFKFDSDSSPLQNKTGRQRQTSTPLRSGSGSSPRISDCDDNEDGEDLPVFDASGHYMEGTFSLSPISQHCVTSSSFNSTYMEKSTKSEPEASSVLFGPSDDHELGFHQGVKSQLFQSTHVRSEDESENEKNKLPATLVSNPISLPRRVLFPNGEVNGTSSSTDSVSNVVTDESTNGIHAETHTVPNIVQETDTSENDEFWEKQFKSLQLAAGNTRELFHSGLNDPEEMFDNNATDDKRFVEDIEAAAEELGSLVLHDLEDTDSKQTVIKETREAICPDAGVNAKLAFENRATTSSAVTEGSQNYVQNPEVDNNEAKMWDINNSIEIRKFKDDTESTLQESGEDFQDIDEAVTKEFVPSKWNQSLLPSRPAIKSPEQQPKSYMKKSVSFEMNKTQLVYEYPPPPVVSDSEEEEKLITPLAAASIPMSSSLDWELTQEELEDAEINHEDWDDDVLPKPGDPMDVYRISGFSDDNFQVRGSNEPFVISPSTLGELRHTRDRLRLDLNRGEANFLEEEATKSNPTKLDSGVGSSTNVSPFNNCDILTKRSKNSE